MLNCGARLQGRYCHDCGQSADDHHRSILHLAWEAVEGFTHLDGRLAKTLPALLLRPGSLARDHIEGRRTRHVPPFRLFLICLLLFMLAMESAFHHPHPQEVVLSSSGRAPSVQVHALTPSQMDAEIGKIQLSDKPSALETWLKAHLPRAIHNPEYFQMVAFEWAHRLAVLLLPILAALLTLAYARRRRFYVYDHLVVAMQYLAFCFLVWAVVWVAPHWASELLFFPAFIWTPANLYMILRGTYGSGRIAAGLKALVLWVATLSLFGLLVVGLLVLALNQV